MKVLIVEDDPVYAKYLHYSVELNPDHEAVILSTGRLLLDYLKNEPSTDCVVTLDYSLENESCEAILHELKSQYGDIQVVVISAQHEISTAVELLKLGAYDYIEKNDDTRNRLLNVLKHVEENKSLKDELKFVKAELKTKYDFQSVIKGSSSAIQTLFKLMKKAVETNITVSITGETGTGKELVAKSIHFNSRNSGKPLVSLNMAAIPPELVESELFGHEKGAFTGAAAKRIGKFEEANGGTLFLDEIAELDLNLQSKLLRALQEREISPIGSNRIVKLKLRLIVASHKNLAEEVKKGRFREDLYYRILGLPIELPPLRDRGTDILLLSRFFVDQFCLENELYSPEIDESAKNKLLSYSWPGNVRELKAIVELAVVMCSNSVISEKDIIFKSTRNSPEFLFQEMSMKEYTSSIVKHYLNKYNNDVIVVAEKLNIGKSTIYRMLNDGRLSKK